MNKEETFAEANKQNIRNMQARVLGETIEILRTEIGCLYREIAQLDIKLDGSKQELRELVSE